MKARKFLALVCALVLACSLVCVARADSVAWVVTGNRGGLNVRSYPSYGDNVVGSLPYGTQVTVVAYTGSWAQIRYSGMTGYVVSSFLSSTNPSSSGTTPGTSLTPVYQSFTHCTPYVVYVKPTSYTGFVNMRWAPSTSEAVMEICYRNYVLNVIATGGAWCQVSDPATGYVGFMMTEFLSTSYN